MGIINHKESPYECPKRVSLNLVYTRQGEFGVTLKRFSALALTIRRYLLAYKLVICLKYWDCITGGGVKLFFNCLS